MSGRYLREDLLDHNGYFCPPFVAISPAREHEVQRARSLRLPKGSIVVEDMGYADYDRYAQLYVFLTNHFKLAAKTIADICKERWQIEIFFRFIKQNLEIKAFIGNSENPVLRQIYAALIVYPLLCYLKFKCNLNITLQNCLRILQLNLFRTCTWQELFQPPGTMTANMCNSIQLSFALA